jgi:hypothetical protein
MVLSTAAAVGLLVGPGSGASRAYDPTPALRNLYGAPHAVIWLMQVKPGQEAELASAVLASGPYNKLLSGFASEKLLEPLPVQAGTRLYISFGRYYDRGTAAFVEPERMRALHPFLASSPVRVELSLVEHMLADWGWERGTASSVLRAAAFENDEIFQKNVSSLSFFKAGYVGQVGMIEFFEPGADLESVRKTVSGRAGLSGASIYRVRGQERYVVYSEFFKAPLEIAQKSLRHLGPGTMPLGTQVGIVVQNYVPR